MKKTPQCITTKMRGGEGVGLQSAPDGPKEVLGVGGQ